MIPIHSSAVLYLNKLSVLLISSVLILFWLNLELTKPIEQYSITNDNILNQSKDSKYLKTTVVNPFLHSHKETVSNDVFPTITALQSSIPPFKSLNIRLHGIVYISTQQSYALISVNGAIQEIISVNGEIDEGLYLINIAKKQVEVDYFGERHVLFIDSIRSNQQLAEGLIVNKNETNSLYDFNEQIDHLEVDKQRNPIRLFMIRRPYAVYSNGEFQGYKIMPGSNADQFKRLGFQSGDIITYLNGIEFTGPGKKEFVIQELTHAAHIDLTVMRSGQELTINYGF